MAIWPPPLANPCYSTLAYNRFMQEPYCAANHRSPWRKNRAISHFTDATVSHDFVLCIGIIPLRTTAKQFFEAIETRLCPGNHFQKLKVVRNMVNLPVENGSGAPKSNTQLILLLRQTLVLFKKLKVGAEELEGLIAQAACHAPPALDQLVTAAILAKNEDKPSSTFVGQVILNGSSKAEYFARNLSSFVYGMADSAQISSSPTTTAPSRSMTKGFANLNPCPRSPSPFTPARVRAAEPQSPLASNPRFYQERVSQVQFLEHHAADKVLIDSGAFIHLSGSSRFASDLRSIDPFKTLFANSKSSITVVQTVTLKLPVYGGYVVIRDVAFSGQILGSILSVGQLCKAGIMPFFSELSLSLLVRNRLVHTTFLNNCCWMNIVSDEGTNGSEAVSPSPRLIEMNPISQPTSMVLSSCNCHRADIPAMVEHKGSLQHVLNSMSIKEVVLLDPPTSFLPDLEGKVLQLKKALYGMRQAGRCWCVFILNMLANLGFNASEVDQSFYFFKKGGVTIVIWMHVDDGVVSSNFPEAIQDFRKNICLRLDVKWKDSVSRIVSLECGFGEGEVTITQQHLTDGILDSYPQAIFHHDAPLPPSPATDLGQ
ncbi:hypothetical protein O181_032369 [Austropuccinia psidii MF-1]|uniref:Reverse transcriptase Ty1/copia-type domain-containing protein n=1 Tax=Austropuccinia psidii MF-1 TaxID=1389203 RepID=A0A9Q3H7G6_9BASI|nr:hypothetical protein [Austropuccinia psidii MF-1]